MKRILLLVFLMCTAGMMLAQRLPDTATPSHYQIRLAPDLKTATFTGDETIDINVLKPTSTITLNALEIDFKTVTITQNGAEQTASVDLDPKDEMVKLNVPKPLAVGLARIHILYNGKLNDQLRGFYLSKGKTRNYAVTQMEPTDARRAFPSFDEPAMKATFAMSVVADKGDMAISNGSVIADVPGPEADKHTITFSTTPKISSYLVAMLVGDFKCREGGQDGIPIRVCVTPEKYPYTQAALEAAEHNLQYYDKYFDIKYPYKKLDIIGVPDFSAGAMENVAAITYREVLLLVDPKTASPQDYKTVADILAHEMAHQWFGDLVTMKWWNDIWLNEGFATWMSPKPVNAWHPEWNNRMDEVDSDNGAKQLDALNSTRAVRMNAVSSADIGELFDPIAYNKAAAILRMVENYVGPEVFRKGANLYLKEHAYSNTDGPDFWNTITRVSHKPVDKIMQSFMEQPGVPLLNVAATCKAGNTTLQLSQERFFEDPPQDAAANTEQWTIPVCEHTAGGNSCQLMTQKQQSFQIKGCSPWLYANANAMGYYNTTYSPELTGPLAQNFTTELKPDERLDLVNDQWALVDSGKLSVANYLDLVSKLKNEDQRAIWESISQHLNFIHDRLLSEADRPKFEAWVRDLATPTAQKLGWSPQPGESADTKAVRARVIGLLGGLGKDPAVIAKSKELAQAGMKDPTSVDPDLLPVVLAIAARNGDEAFYNQVLATMQKQTNPADFYMYAQTLERFKQPDLVQRNLQMVLSPQVRSQDAMQALFGLLGNPETQQQAWQFIRSDWPQLKNKLQTYDRAQAIFLGTTFCSPEKRAEVQQFFGSQNIPGGERPMKMTLEVIDSCVRVKNQQQSNLESWLKQQPQMTAGN